MAKDTTKAEAPPQLQRIPPVGSRSALKVVEEEKTSAEATSIDKAIEETMPSLEDIANMSLEQCNEWHDDKSFVDEDK